MHYTLKLECQAYHKASQRWHCHAIDQGIRAVSRKHALSKGLKVIEGWISYQDRVTSPYWEVSTEATILEPEKTNV